MKPLKEKLLVGKDFTKDEFYQLISFSTIKEAINQKILKIIEKREESENQNTENHREKRTNRFRKYRKRR